MALAPELYNAVKNIYVDPELYNAVKCGDQNFIRQLHSSDETTLLKVTPQTGTTLHVAARFRKTEIAKMILKWHPSLLYQNNSDGDTPLHIAARIGDSDMVRLLVNRDQVVEEAYGKLVQIANVKGETALHDAVRGGHIEVVKLLIEKDPLLATLTTGGGESPLFLAVERMHMQVAEHILSILSDDTPSCSFQGLNNMNALHAAIIRGCNLDFIKELLGNMSPAAILERDNSGWTALHHAACLGELSILEELLSTDNSIAYARDEEGLTALHIAAKEGRVDIMQKLVQKCPDIWGLIDNKGQTALHVAAKIGKGKIVKFILKEIPDDIINRQDNEGNSSLHLAALGQNIWAVHLLRSDGRVDKRAINNEGSTFWDIEFSVQNQHPSKGKVIASGDARHLASLERVMNKRNKQGMLSVNGVELEQIQEGRGKPFENNIPAVKDDEKGKAEGVTDSYNTVVATLIASASFAAAVAMPGGYRSDGLDAGLAVLGRKASFKAFVVANSLAFALSAGSMFGYFSTWSGSPGWRLSDPEIIGDLIFYSVISWLVAFITGSYAVLTDDPVLSAAVVLLTLYIFFYIVFLYSPLGQKFVKILKQRLEFLFP